MNLFPGLRRSAGILFRGYQAAISGPFFAASRPHGGGQGEYGPEFHLDPRDLVNSRECMS
jgi:hypothetical protein